MNYFLDFEKKIQVLEDKIENLRFEQNDSAVDISNEIENLQKKSKQLLEEIYSKLSPWEITQVSRHPNRPYTLDYVNAIFDDFTELHGDRHFSDDPAIVAGLANFNKRPVAVVGHQKGKDTKEKIFRNFGMPKPEGYRKALRVMQLANKYKLPIFTFIDTPGAYPGIGAEERSQSEAIGRNLYEMVDFKVPIIVTIIGEGGSGGALALAVGDRILMMKYSTYSVISPEGCASILWKNSSKASRAASALGITANKLKELGLIDHIVKEPLGGAHRDHEETFLNLKSELEKNYENIKGVRTEDLLDSRINRIMNYGQFK